MAPRSGRSQPTLPAFVSPMLAKKGDPFDSREHLFEIKWDGTRMLAFVEPDGYRLVNRHRAERTAELACLTELPAGVILDGEVVVFHDGRPDFRRLLSRDQAGAPFKIRLSARSLPAASPSGGMVSRKSTALVNTTGCSRSSLPRRRCSAAARPSRDLNRCASRRTSTWPHSTPPSTRLAPTAWSRPCAIPGAGSSRPRRAGPPR